mmetsp:Transcript_8232/g.20340  ORF Transcript_8232/g.20340 Transcript_8232/m.20340 type:complete len:212 (-) Transcript_8232:152-787(-)
MNIPLILPRYWLLVPFEYHYHAVSKGLVGLLRQLPGILHRDVDDLWDPLLQVVRYPIQDGGPLVPEPALQPEDDDGSVQLHVIHAAGDPDPPVLGRVPEERPDLLPAGVQHGHDRRLVHLQLGAGGDEERIEAVAPVVDRGRIQAGAELRLDLLVVFFLGVLAPIDQDVVVLVVFQESEPGPVAQDNERCARFPALELRRRGGESLGIRYR